MMIPSRLLVLVVATISTLFSHWIVSKIDSADRSERFFLWFIFSMILFLAVFFVATGVYEVLTGAVDWSHYPSQ